ncbi:flagellar biosynthesis protein FlhG [Alkalispirochaeta americana]|uniref:Flagellar biosynthesis protein FlhG n=1 Tax=Alkalispirochaeta americana TaxID=159291 RepID=A0A1N6PXF6_9SPIO|nr:P-loop NTPase [Alkalispirochaeta americana]SIQ09011.1 flagellar biosynthesis protein FlhG [Alkalispirochaeta americana]
MQHLIPIASGKGGVGKTLLAANLGIALAQQGKTVVLIDLDLGGSNLHTLLGIRNSHPGIGHFIYKKAETLEELLVETSQHQLFLIPGDGLFCATANLPFHRKQAILKQLPDIPADFVILDLGSGTTYNTLDLFLTSSAGLLVTSPDTTAILNAYSFLKSAMFRLLQRSFSAKSSERHLVMDFLQQKMEGGNHHIQELVEQIHRLDAESGNRAREALSQFRPRVVMNMGRTAQDIRLGGRLRKVVQDNLKSGIEFIAYLPQDEYASRSPLERTPTLLRYPECPYSQGIKHCAHRIIQEPVPPMQALFEDDQDLQELADQFGNLL